MQTTVKSEFTLRGIGLHSGRAVSVIVRPAPADHGIWFKRTDVVQGCARIPALWSAVERTALCTRLVNADGVSLSTVEHIMAALAGCGIHNALVEVNGPEIPILDGSAKPFVAQILRAGVCRLGAPVAALEILKPVSVQDGLARASLLPAEGLVLSFEIDFPDAAIGRQARSLNMANGAFVRELCDCRTFCREADVERMRANGLALGGSLANAVVVSGASVRNPEGLRRRDEPVRHKMLDALGDLALAGAPLLARYEGVRAGHALTNTLLRTVFADDSAYRVVTLDAQTARCLPGVGIGPEDLRHVA